MTATAEVPLTRAEINRRNARRSTGPKSQAGKERSRFNALKHGCRARLPILPGEDPEAYQERLEAWIDKFQPRDAVETYMVERAVQASWQLDRADRAEVATMVEAAEELALGRAREVLALGETLFRAPARPRRRARRPPRPRRRRPAPLLAVRPGTSPAPLAHRRRAGGHGAGVYLAAPAVDGAVGGPRGRADLAAGRPAAGDPAAGQAAARRDRRRGGAVDLPGLPSHGPGRAQPVGRAVDRRAPPRGGAHIQAGDGAVRGAAGRAVAAGSGGGPGGAAGDRVGGRGAAGGNSGGSRGGGGGDGRPVGGLVPDVLPRQGDGGVAVEASGEVQPVAVPDLRRAAQGPTRLRRRPAGFSRSDVRRPWSVVGE